MTALVTGATGFVGSAVVRRLLDRGWKVRVLARPGSDRRNLDGLPVELAEGDLTDRSSLEAAVKGCSALFHVAADYRIWVPKPKHMYRTNVEGTVDLLRAAARHGVERIVYTSSVAALGLPTDGTPGTEATPVSLDDMIGHYKRSKYLAEEAVQRLIHDEGVPAVIVNPSTPIGPRDLKPTPTGRVILDAVSGRMPAYVDTGLNIVHVDDCAEGHLRAFDHGQIGERYILGGDNLTLESILTTATTLAGRKPPKVRLPHRAILPLAFAVEAWARLFGLDNPFVTVDGVRMSMKKMYFTSAKAERELGYTHRPADQALADAVAWFRQQGSVG